MTLYLAADIAPPNYGQAIVMTACYTDPGAAQTTADLNALVNSVAFN